MNCAKKPSLTLVSTVHVLGSNGISGSVPTEIGLLSNLVDLQLGDNLLTGNVPSQLGTLSSLQGLSLDDNRLSGPIPSELGQISTLQVLRLRSNALTGTRSFRVRALAKPFGSSD
jgi:Leucine-rich repeat (LRR) protein